MQSPPHRKEIKAKDFLHLLQGHICVFQILGPFGAPEDQHPPALRVQGCRNGFLFLSPLHCYQHNQWMKSLPKSASDRNPITTPVPCDNLP
ncbi:hypothetical protein G5714_004649 [Onychostoma macrolepis]|uniref:Uncharacterized protein n=1 Tax=Onychostoma macrolepis TaxID=369639 RepID=A0A7J6D5A8_9TELE|nr:hypothetical protein G5714_004649 [Onychostoma macrolepis]